MAEKQEVVANVVNLPLNALVVGENVRFGLKPYRVESLANSITQFGGVHTPLKVEPYENGTYLVREGNYRYAAVQTLNKKGAGLLLPCIVEERTDPIDRIKHQLSENLDRENMSPMDIAVTIGKLKESGLDRTTIRGMFQKPGGRKGLGMQPMSTAMYHFYLGFLEFPKKIQVKIHDGTLPVASAIELLGKPQATWETILDKAEENRQHEMDQEEKDDTKILQAEQKQAEEQARIEEQKGILEARDKERQQWEAEAAKRREAASELYKKIGLAKGEDKKDTEKLFRAAEAEAKVAETKANDARKEAEKIQAKLDNFNKQQAERAKKLEEARKEAERKAKIRKEDVQKAAAQVQGGPMPLNATDMRSTIQEWCLPGSFPKVASICKVIDKVFKGILTPGQGLSEMGYITGERKEKPKTMKAMAAAAPVPVPKKKKKEDEEDEEEEDE